LLTMPATAFTKILYGAAGLLLFCSLTLNRCQQERLSALSAELERAAEANSAQTLALLRLEEEIRLNDGILAQRELKQREIRREEAAGGHKLEQEKQNDEVFKNWADQPLPDVLLRVLQAGADANQAPAP
jgi:hypothetical protein